MNEKFFKTSKELRHWFNKNHLKASELWIVFYKKGYGEGLSQREAVDQALCFGWIYSIIRNRDAFTYVMKFAKRKANSIWSKKNMERLRELEKQGIVTQAGLEALKSRDKSKSEEKAPAFLPKELKIFKGNKAAWSFFSSQTKSYQKYTTAWVASAKKSETRLRRFEELVKDSADQTKLLRIVKATEKYQKKFEPGKTPIEEAKNIGPTTGAELRSIGITTVEKFKELGWEDVFRKLCEAHPHRINLNMVVGLAASSVDVSFKKIDSHLKREAVALLKEVRSDFKSDKNERRW